MKYDACLPALVSTLTIVLSRMRLDAELLLFLVVIGHDGLRVEMFLK